MLVFGQEFLSYLGDGYYQFVFLFFDDLYVFCCGFVNGGDGFLNFGELGIFDDVIFGLQNILLMFDVFGQSFYFVVLVVVVGVDEIDWFDVVFIYQDQVFVVVNIVVFEVGGFFVECCFFGWDIGFLGQMIGCGYCCLYGYLIGGFVYVVVW